MAGRLVADTTMEDGGSSGSRDSIDVKEHPMRWKEALWINKRIPGYHRCTGLAHWERQVVNKSKVCDASNKGNVVKSERSAARERRRSYCHHENEDRRVSQGFSVSLDRVQITDVGTHYSARATAPISVSKDSTSYLASASSLRAVSIPAELR